MPNGGTDSDRDGLHSHTLFQRAGHWDSAASMSAGLLSPARNGGLLQAGQEKCIWPNCALGPALASDQLAPCPSQFACECLFRACRCESCAPRRSFVMSEKKDGRRPSERAPECVEDEKAEATNGCAAF